MTPPLYFATQNIGEVGGNLSTTSLCCCFNFSLLCGYFSFSPVLQSSIGERPKKLPFLRRGVEQYCLIVYLTPSPYGYSPYIPLRKRLAVLWGTAGEEGKPDIKDYRLYRSISSMMSRRLYSRGILCCPPSLLWSRNQASNIPVLAGMISRHSSAILLNRLAS